MDFRQVKNFFLEVIFNGRSAAGLLSEEWHFLAKGSVYCRSINILPGSLLRSFPCFAVRSSSVQEGKIIIFERFHCSLIKIVQLN